MLELWLGPGSGSFQGRRERWLRFFDRDGNMLPSGEEIVEAERRRAEAAEAELAALKARLAQLEKQ